MFSFSKLILRFIFFLLKIIYFHQIHIFITQFLSNFYNTVFECSLKWVINFTVPWEGPWPSWLVVTWVKLALIPCFACMCVDPEQVKLQSTAQDLRREYLVLLFLIKKKFFFYFLFRNWQISLCNVFRTQENVRWISDPTCGVHPQ